MKQFGKSKSEPPIVSIILPCRNALKVINRCLSSIIEQTLKDWELIAVDDNSSDGTYDLLLSASRQDKRIRAYRSPGKGIVDALNFGIGKSRTRLIARMDADDRMLASRLRKQFDYLSAHPETDLVASRVLHKCDGVNPSSNGFSHYVKWSNQVLSEKNIDLAQFEESPVVHPSVMYKKDLLATSGGYRDGPFPEDYELWLRCLSEGAKFHKLNDILLEWFDSSVRASRNQPQYSLEAFQYTKALYLKSWLIEKGLNGKSICAWGAGVIAKKQAKLLSQNNIRINKFYDIDPLKIGKSVDMAPVCNIEEISLRNHEFLLILSGARSIKPKIRSFLNKKKLIAGEHYLFLA
jgi:glycosyltransferase involved in cell wall biosynthesis